MSFEVGVYFLLFAFCGACGSEHKTKRKNVDQDASAVETPMQEPVSDEEDAEEDAAADGSMAGAALLDGAPDSDTDGGAPDVFIPSADDLVDLSFAEDAFVLTKPAALQPLLELASSSQMGTRTRMFVNAFSREDSVTHMQYGAADLVDGELVWQFPAAQRSSFDVTVDAADARVYRSGPSTYHLLARMRLLGQTFRLSLRTEDAIYEAHFDQGFTRIERGSLDAVLTRVEAEGSPLNVPCLQYCPEACVDRLLLANLAELLDCKNTLLDLDRDGDGVGDAYSLRVEFRSSRALVKEPQ